MKKQIIILVIFAIPMLLTFQNCQRSNFLVMTGPAAKAQQKANSKLIPNVDKPKSGQREQVKISDAVDAAISEQNSASKAFERKPQSAGENRAPVPLKVIDSNEDDSDRDFVGEDN